METIRRYIGEFRLPKALFTIPRFRLAPILSTPELLMLTFMMAFGSWFLAFQQRSLEFKSISLPSPSMSLPGDSDLLAPRAAGSAVNELRAAGFQLSAELKDRYSFQDVSLGFFINDLSFIERRHMVEIEAEMIQSLPKGMRARGKQYVRPVLLLSEKHQIDPFWVLSIMWTESHFRPTAKSHVGAMGLMQIMPKTKAWIYKRHVKQGGKLVVENQLLNLDFFFNQEISRPQLEFYRKKLVNIELGIIYLKYLLNKFDGNHRLATVAYNMGPGWTRYRLRKKLPVGEKNLYLTKVERAYEFLSKSI